MKVQEHTAVLLLGGNLGDVKWNFKKVIEKLNQIGTVQSISSLYGTKPWAMPKNTPDFLNQCIILTTTLNAFQLLCKTNDIETYLGREKKVNETDYKSRPIDIDILFFDDEVIESQNLTIPHPRLHLRNFTLEPLYELIPNYIHPVLKKSIKDLRIESNDILKAQKV